MAFDPAVSTRLAKEFSSLHQPGNALVLTNVWDPPSTEAALSFPSTKAIATASYAIAACAGLEDDDLTLTANLNALTLIRNTLVKSGKADSIPLSVDLQDGYGDQIVEAVEKMVELGVVGVNLEDALREEIGGPGKVIPAKEQGERIKLVIETARRKGVEGLVVNARTDCVKHGGTIEEAIERGKIYLKSGATTVFVFGAARGLRDAEVKQLVDGLEGKVAVIHKRAPGFLNIQEVKSLGVARISMGPGLWREGMAAVEQAMKATVES